MWKCQKMPLFLANIAHISENPPALTKKARLVVFPRNIIILFQSLSKWIFSISYRIFVFVESRRHLEPGDVPIEDEALQLLVEHLVYFLVECFLVEVFHVKGQLGHLQPAKVKFDGGALREGEQRRWEAHLLQPGRRFWRILEVIGGKGGRLTEGGDDGRGVFRVHQGADEVEGTEIRQGEDGAEGIRQKDDSRQTDTAQGGREHRLKMERSVRKKHRIIG